MPKTRTSVSKFLVVTSPSVRENKKRENIAIGTSLILEVPVMID